MQKRRRDAPDTAVTAARAMPLVSLYLPQRSRFGAFSLSTSQLNTKSGHKSKVALTDLEYAYAPVRDQVRDLREYL